jgi:predicted Zn finger-like uncharacterized protein
MSISFACPECKAQIEVGDEFAGHAGQCPRCQQVITIPSPNLPKPKPIVVSIPGSSKDKWDDPRDNDRPRSSRGDGGRARMRRPPPRQPSGPMWPWAIGIAGAVVVVLLLFISFIVLVSYRKPEPPRVVIIDTQQGVIPPGNNPQGMGVVVGRLDGPCAFLQDGVFQVRSKITFNDPFDRVALNSRTKHFQVELLDNMDYIIEVESNHFDADIRLETLNRAILGQGFGNRGALSAVIRVRTGFRQEHLDVWVTNAHQAVGDFTLTIREAHRPRP